MTPEEQYALLIESLKLIAAPYDTQVSVLPDFVDLVFEVVDTYENAFFILPSIISNDYLSRQNIASLINLYAQAMTTYSNDDLCTHEQFKENIRWNNIRKMASEILISLDISGLTPDLKHISWVKG